MMVTSCGPGERIAMDYELPEGTPGATGQQSFCCENLWEKKGQHSPSDNQKRHQPSQDFPI